MADVLAGFRGSTHRQYQSCWKAFQSYLRAVRPTSLTRGTVFRFLSHMFHVRNRRGSTLRTYVASLDDPLRLAFNIQVRGRDLDLIFRGFFNQRPPRRPRRVFWSLQKVLDLLVSPRYLRRPSVAHLLRRALFLVAMASGLRASQLHALLRIPGCLVIAEDSSQMSLAPDPAFLAKNEREGHILSPVVIPAWRVDGHPHDLCPVAALEQYIEATRDTQESRLFLSSTTGSPLSRRQLSTLLCRIIQTADPGHGPVAQDIRRLSSTLAFLRQYSVDMVRRDGQWSSSYSFVHHYLQMGLRDVPCVAMSGAPSTSA